MKKPENGRKEKQEDLLTQKERLGLELDEEYIHLAKVILETTEKHSQRINRLVDSMILTNQRLERTKVRKRKDQDDNATSKTPEE